MCLEAVKSESWAIEYGINPLEYFTVKQCIRIEKYFKRG